MKFFEPNKASGVFLAFLFLMSGNILTAHATNNKLFDSKKPYCWDVEIAGEPPAIIELRFLPLGAENYLAGGYILEDGDKFAIHGNSILIGSTVRFTTLLAGAGQVESTSIVGGGVATIDLNAHTLNGKVRGIEVGATSAVMYEFHWTGQIAGFSVKGRFSYDETKVDDTSIVREEDLLSFDVSFYDPDGNLLRTYVDNHIEFELFNFAFDTESGEILQDGTYNKEDGFLMGEGDPALRSEPLGTQQGLAFWSRPRDDAVPHLHVDDWNDDFGFPPGFSSHEDVAFFTRTTQELVDTGRVGEAYVDNPASEPDDFGQRVETVPAENPNPTAYFEADMSFIGKGNTCNQ